MKIFIVYWHPEPQSFNGAMFRTACAVLAKAGHEVKTSNLYEMNFDPASSRRNFTTVKDPNNFKPQIEEMHASENNGFAPEIETEIQKIEWCDLMIWQFPLWWFSLPAVLKGWVDRVFAMGRTYGRGRMYQNGVFRGKRALLSLTTGGPEQAYGEGSDMLAILRPIHRGILQVVGFDVLAPQIVYGPVHKTADDRALHLAEYADRLLQIHEETTIDIGRF